MATKNKAKNNTDTIYISLVRDAYGDVIHLDNYYTLKDAKSFGFGHCESPGAEHVIIPVVVKKLNGFDEPKPRVLNPVNAVEG